MTAEPDPTTTNMTPSNLRTEFDPGCVDFSKGLVPAVIVHAISGRVLMVAWCDRAALDKTLATGLVTFFSRSRQQLWTKGETSGNLLHLQSVSIDCDNDTLLLGALPKGPVCHTGTLTCFDEQHSNPSSKLIKQTTSASDASLGGFLHQLENIIQQRSELQTESYTASLLRAGVSRIAQKVGEEGVEVALAGVQQDQQNLVNESADLLYHLLVLLRANKCSLDDVLQVLHARHTKSAS